MPIVLDHDWARVCMDILSRGVSKNRLALAAGSTRERVYSMLAGRYKPTWAEGQALLCIREAMCAHAANSPSSN